MLSYINFCFLFCNLSSNDIIYLTRASLPLTSSRGWSRYIDIQRLVNIFSDRNSSTGCFVTLRFPFSFFFFLLAEIRSGNRDSLSSKRKIKDISYGWGKNFALIRWSNRDLRFLLLRWKIFKKKKFLQDLLTQFLYRLSTNSSAIPMIVN